MWNLPNFRRRRYRKDDGHDSPAACSPDAREDGISLFITNAAVNNIARRAEAKNEDEEFLYVRIHPESLEHTAIMSYDEKNPNKGYSSLKKAKRPSKFCWEMSVASRVLQVSGVIQTKNKRLLDLKEKSLWVCEVLQKPREECDDQDKENAPKLIRTVCERIVDEANVVFSTCITSTSKWDRKFRESVGTVIIDEAGAVTLLESLIVWNGNTPLILVGDNNQLPTQVMSALQRFENRKTINAFFRQLQQPLIHALIENDWPYWLMPEQLPVEPGLFDLPNHVTYEDKTTYHKNNKLSEEGKAFENWCQKFSRECSRVTFKPAPDGMAYPMLISVRNANTLREARGSSKGNRKYIHHGIKSLLHFMEANPSVKAEETIILTPYLK